MFRMGTFGLHTSDQTESIGRYCVFIWLREMGTDAIHFPDAGRSVF